MYHARSHTASAGRPGLTAPPAFATTTNDLPALFPALSDLKLLCLVMGDEDGKKSSTEQCCRTEPRHARACSTSDSDDDMFERSTTSPLPMDDFEASVPLSPCLAVPDADHPTPPASHPRVPNSPPGMGPSVGSTRIMVRPVASRKRSVGRKSGESRLTGSKRRRTETDPHAEEYTLSRLLMDKARREAVAAEVAKLVHGPDCRLGRFYGSTVLSCERCRNCFKDRQKKDSRSPTQSKAIVRRMRLQACRDIGMQDSDGSRSSKKRQRVTQSTKGDASKGTCAVAARMLELLEEAIAGVEAPRL